jgi:hypothetical protein
MSAQRPGELVLAKYLFDARQCSASDKSTVARAPETTISASFAGVIAARASVTTLVVFPLRRSGLRADLARRLLRSMGKGTRDFAFAAAM